MIPVPLGARLCDADGSTRSDDAAADPGARGAPPAPLPRLHFATLLFGLVLAVLVPSFILGVVAIIHAVSGQRAVAEARLQNTAQVLALAVDADISMHLQALRTLGSQAVFDPGADADPPAVDAVLRRGAAVLDSSIALILPDGSRIAHTDLPPGKPIPPTGQVAALQQVLRTGQPHVIDLHRGAVAGVPTVSAMVPVLRQGRVVSILSMRIAPQHLQQRLAAAGLDPGSFAALVDSRQAVVARSDMPDYQFIGRVVPPDSAAALAQGGSGLFRATSHDGIPQVFGFHDIPTLPGWHVVVGDPAAVLDAAWRDPLLVLGGGGTLIFVLACVLAMLLARRVLTPLRHLGSHARAVAVSDGNLDDDFTAERLQPAAVTELEALRRGFAAAEAALHRRAQAERAAAAALAAREAELRAIFDTSPVGIVRGNFQGQVLDANEVALRLFGVAREDLKAGQVRWSELTPPEYINVTRRAIAEALASPDGRCAPYEKEFVLADGTRIAVLNSFAILNRDAGEVAGFMMDLSAIRRSEAMVAESEARLRAIGEATPALIFALDRQNRMIYANPATLAVIGKPAEEVLGKVASDYHSNAAELRELSRSNERVMESGQPETVEESFSTDTGTPRIFLSTKAPLRDPATGDVSGITIISRDITQQRAGEAMQARLAAIVASTPDAVVSVAAEDGRIQSWNRAAEDLYGWTEAEALGQPLAMLITDHLAEADPNAVYAATLAGTMVRDLETIRKAKSGELIPVSVTASRIEAPDGRAIGMSAIFRDLRPRRKAEAALRESEERLRLATGVAQVGIFDWNPRTNELRWDQRLRSMWGMPADRRDLRELAYDGMHPEDVPRVKAAVAAALDPAGTGICEAEFRLRQPVVGAARIVAVRGRVWFENGAAARMIGTVVDVTAQRLAEAVLARDKAELSSMVEARTRELKQVQEQLAHAQRMEALGRLAGGIAHDFNNVLQAVQGGVAIAARRLRSNPDRALSFLEMVTTAVDRGAAVTNRLLAFARRSELSAGSVAPGPLLEGLAQLLQPTLGSRIRLVVSVEPDMPDIFVDANQLETVIVNLANNARDALPEDGGTIRLVAATAPAGEAPVRLGSGHFARLSVIDDGAGMTRDVLARVTEPFFTTKPKGKGTGLGLAMARGFAEQSGGVMSIESEPGVGTTASLWLPIAPVAELDIAIDRDAPPAEADAGWSGIAMLLVDDDPAVRIVLAGMLTEQGHAVTQASDAAAALALVDANVPADVLVTDLTMPGDMDGLALVREARRRRPGLPAVLITGNAGAAGAEALGQAGGSGPFAVLNKPVSAQALTARVVELVQGR